MDSPRNELPESLAFDRYDMAEGVPVSLLFSLSAAEHVCGIYILEFSDGARYVGQTKNIARRYGEHQHKHGDVTAFSFASCGQEMLDDYERAVIKVQEQGHDLRNKLLTDHPGGAGPLEIMLSDVATVKLPWDRTKRSTVQQESSGSKNWRFWKLTRRPDYERIRNQLARYVHETIPSPVQTAGFLWTLTAYPSTSRTKGRRRLLTLNVSNVEALYLTEYDLEDGGTELGWVLNAWPEALAAKLEALTGPWLEKASFCPVDSYSTAGPIIAITAIDTETFAKVIDLDFVLDAAYRLNVSMMRRSKSVFAKFHNDVFAADVFREISVSTYSGTDTPTQLTREGRLTWRKYFFRWLFGTR